MMRFFQFYVLSIAVLLSSIPKAKTTVYAQSPEKSDKQAQSGFSKKSLFPVTTKKSTPKSDETLRSQQPTDVMLGGEKTQHVFTTPSVIVGRRPPQKHAVTAKEIKTFLDHATKTLVFSLDLAGMVLPSAAVIAAVGSIAVEVGNEYYQTGKISQKTVAKIVVKTAIAHATKIQKIATLSKKAIQNLEKIEGLSQKVNFVYSTVTNAIGPLLSEHVKHMKILQDTLDSVRKDSKKKTQTSAASQPLVKSQKKKSGAGILDIQSLDQAQKLKSQ